MARRARNSPQRDGTWFLGPDPPGRNEQFVHYITTYKDNYEEHSYDGEIAKTTRWP